MPPDEDEKEKKKGWKRYSSWIYVGIVVVLVVVGAAVARSNDAGGSGVTLAQVSSQVGEVRTTVDTLTSLVSHIPTVDQSSKLASLETLLNSTALQMNTYYLSLSAVVEEMSNVTSENRDLLLALNETVSAGLDWLAALNQTVMSWNETIWQDHQMLLQICEALNITEIT